MAAVLTAGPMVAVLTVVGMAIPAVVNPMVVAAPTAALFTVGPVAAVLAAGDGPTPTTLSIAPPVVEGSTAAALKELATDTDALSAEILAIARQLGPRRGAAAPMEQFSRPISRRIPLHQGDREAMSLPPATGGGTHLETAGISLSQEGMAHRVQSATVNGIRLKTVAAAPSLPDEGPRVHGREEQQIAGMAKATKRLRIALDRPSSRTLRCRVGLQIPPQRLQIEGLQNLREEQRGR